VARYLVDSARAGKHEIIRLVREDLLHAEIVRQGVIANGGPAPGVRLILPDVAVDLEEDARSIQIGGALRKSHPEPHVGPRPGLKYGRGGVAVDLSIRVALGKSHRRVGRQRERSRGNTCARPRWKWLGPVIHGARDRATRSGHQGVVLDNHHEFAERPPVRWL